MNTNDSSSKGPTRPEVVRQIDDQERSEKQLQAEAQLRLQEATRLKQIYTERKKQDRTLTQEKVAELCGWSGQSTVSQYMTGKIPLNINAIIKLSEVLDFDISDVSPRLSAVIRMPAIARGVAKQISEMQRKEIPDISRLIEPVVLWDDETPLGDDEVEVPFFNEVELSAGAGSTVVLETNGRKFRFGRRTLTKKGIDPAAVGCALVNGNSMEPVLPDGSTVGVDTSAQTVQDGKMYAIDHDGQLRVKILYRTPGGGLRLRSYNSEEHPDERYELNYVAENIRIIGRVFWYSVLL
jgi:phage repressor protein C with HTH and peptisase S24 domain